MIMTDVNIQSKDRFDKLNRKLSLICSHFGMYRSIFDKPKLTAELNDIDGPFFFALELRFRDSIVLELAKFLDDVEVKKRGKTIENLSLRNVIQSYLKEENLSEEKRRIFNKLNDKAQSFSFEIQDIRNKYLAHNDLQHHLNIEVVKFPDYPKILEIIEFCKSAMNKVAFNVFGSEVGYPDTDANGLIYVLSQGLRYQELMKDGKINILDHTDLKKFD